MDNSNRKHTLCCVISCNDCWKIKITAKTLVDILSGKISKDGWEPHIGTFFNEVPHKFILGMMAENNLTMEQLIKVFESQPKVLQDPHFKDLIKKERRSFPKLND